MGRPAPGGGSRGVAVAACAFGLASAVLRPAAACAPAGEPLRIGFFHDFVPVSYSADKDPAGGRFDEHRGYEADLLTALETMGGLQLSRRAIGGGFSGIWLRAAGDEFDIVGGGVTIRDDRTRDAQGRTAILFTAGHIAFAQTLLVRAEDAARLARYEGLTARDVVAVVPGTTGEERFLQLTGYVDAQGRLRAGVRVETAAGTLVADGSDRYAIGAARSSANVEGRRRLNPPAGAADMPRVIYFEAEDRQLGALRSGAADAVARGLIGNADAAAESGGALVVAARDSRVELGGFALAAADTELAACLNERIGWLTDSLRIGYEEWRADGAVFLRRAEAWTGRGGPVSQRLDRAQRSILPEVARSLSASATEAVSGRVAAAFSPAAAAPTGSMLPALASALRAAAARGARAGTPAFHRLLPGASFSLSLGEEVGADSGLPPVVLWGGGDWRRLSGGAAAPRWDGSLTDGHVGADARLHPDLLAGLALFHTRGRFDYAGGGLDLRMTAAHPYLAWRPAQGAELWATAGHGRGRATAKAEAPLLRLSSRLSLVTAAAGGSRELLSRAEAIGGGKLSLSLKGDVSTARLSSRETEAPLEAFTAKTRRARAALAVSHASETAGGSRLVPSLEAGLRHDGGDGAAGAGLELAAGLRYADAASGVTVEARGRWLAAHRSSVEEWGASALARIDPGAAGRGLSFSLAPSFGGAPAAAGALWERGARGESRGARAPAARLDATLGWGFAAFGGVLTPWGATKLAGEEAQDLRAGARLAFGPAFALSVEGGRYAAPARDRSIMLRGDLWF